MEAPWMLERRCRNPGGSFGRLMKGVLAMVIPHIIQQQVDDIYM